MSSQFVGEIRMFGGSFAPAGWAFCDGTLLPISQNDTLFNLIGTTYGGDGQNTFALPDLRGRLPVHQGDGFTLGQTGGVEAVTLTVNQLPAHTHAMSFSLTQANATTPSGNVPAQGQSIYVLDSGLGTVGAANATTPDGGSQPHSNFQPYLCIDFILSLFGVFPSPT